MLRQPVEYTTIPVRLFTRANVGGLALTPASGGVRRVVRATGPRAAVRTAVGSRLAIRGLAARLPRSVRCLAA
jgi:hypothetical protein